jgi:exodeoxyribonuclease V
MMTITLSDQQNQARIAFKEWFKTARQKNGQQVFYLAGWAGTGKTTVATVLASEIDGPIVYGAFTGKAALVMDSKGCTGASTIHSLIYIAKELPDGKVVFNYNSNSVVRSAALVVIDECSMVNAELGKDLLSFGTPVLVLGDPAQLPPVQGEGYFTSRKPDFLLTDIHRQAKENPIIAMSMVVREGGYLPLGVYGDSRVLMRSELTETDLIEADQVLCGKNITRTTMNLYIRSLLGRKDPIPLKDDRLICLRNNKLLGLLNGSLWSVEGIHKRYLETSSLTVKMEDGINKQNVYVHHDMFNGNFVKMPFEQKKLYAEFDFGNCITVHKSQGSQWNNVLIIDESAVFRADKAKHLYTALTRAAEKVTVII